MPTRPLREPFRCRGPRRAKHPKTPQKTRMVPAPARHSPIPAAMSCSISGTKAFSTQSRHGRRCPCPDSSHRPLGRPRLVPRQPNRVALTPPPCTQLAHSKRRRAARRLGAPTADSKSLAEPQTQCAQRAHHRATRRKMRLVIHTRSPQKINSHHSQVTRLAPIRLVKTPRIRLQHFGQDGRGARRVASNM